jgi:hypothetical protein
VLSAVESRAERKPRASVSIRGTIQRQVVAIPREGPIPAVFVRKNGVVHGPVYTQKRIVPWNSALARRIIVVGALVQHVYRIRHCTEAMCKAWRDPERLPGDIVQCDPHPVTECRRSATYVDRNVKNAAPHHAHELALRFSDLIVEASQDIAHGPAVIVLNEFDWKSRDCKLLLIECLEKESARIFPDSWADESHFFEGRSRYFHVTPMGTAQPERLIGGPGNREAIGKVN